jgi:plastocyanin
MSRVLGRNVWVTVAVAATLIGSACAKSATSTAGPSSPSATSSGTSGFEGRGGYGGGGGSSSPAANTVQQGAGGFVFNPSSITVKEGSVITVTNVGTVQHTFTIAAKNIDVLNNPGASQQVTIDLKPGTYTFVCRFHGSQGMTGTLVVTD